LPGGLWRRFGQQRRLGGRVFLVQQFVVVVIIIVLQQQFIVVLVFILFIRVGRRFGLCAGRL
jgi:hypothetical protein